MPVGVCGEMGGRTLEAMALIGIGLTRFSITPAAVGPIKAMIRSLDRAALLPRGGGDAGAAAGGHARGAGGWAEVQGVAGVRKSSRPTPG